MAETTNATGQATSSINRPLALDYENHTYLQAKLSTASNDDALEELRSKLGSRNSGEYKLSLVGQVGEGIMSDEVVIQLHDASTRCAAVSERVSEAIEWLESLDDIQSGSVVLLQPRQRRKR